MPAHLAQRSRIGDDDEARRAMASGLSPDDLDEQRFGEFLYTAGQPDPDLLIRTSGEMRISNFMLWQIAYSELYVTDVAWPDFSRAQLDAAIASYARRERRFGLTGQQSRRAPKSGGPR